MKLRSKTLVQATVGLILVGLTVSVGFFLFAASGSHINPLAGPPVPQTTSTSSPTGTSLPTTLPSSLTSTTLPTATRTLLPLPTQAPTAAPRPTFSPGTPTPMRPIVAWRIYTNTAYAYTVTYPDTWFVNAADPSSVNFTSFPLANEGRSGIDRGQIKVDIWVVTKDVPTALPTGQKFCATTECGVRFTQPTAEPAAQGLNQILVVEFLRLGRMYGITAYISEPADVATLNATIFEKLLASFRFTQ